MNTLKSILLSGIFVCFGYTFQANAQVKLKQQQRTQQTRTSQNQVQKEAPQQRQQQELQGKLTPRYTGELTLEDLKESTYTNRWYEPRYKSYTPDKASLETIEKNINDYDLVLFLGTWCPDSHREVPRIYKILEQTGYDMDKIKTYALNHRMQSEDHDEKDLNITNVPTLIFYKDGKEVNRFVERARENIAKDMAKIVSGQEYKHYHLRN